MMEGTFDTADGSQIADDNVKSDPVSGTVKIDSKLGNLMIQENDQKEAKLKT